MTRDTIFADNFGILPVKLPESVKEATLKAMDEYAKVQAVEFDKWKRGLGLIKEQKTERWLINFSMNEWSLFSENDEQLYNHATN